MKTRASDRRRHQGKGIKEHEPKFTYRGAIMPGSGTESEGQPTVRLSNMFSSCLPNPGILAAQLAVYIVASLRADFLPGYQYPLQE